jgi:UDP-N-acetylglucosamine 1-carboxyvinyltransferase
MDKIVVEGGRRLSGEVEASGAKNSALPLIFASLLTDEPCRLRGVPDVADIRTAAALLASLGARVDFPAPGEISIDCSTVDRTEADYELVRRMRASFLVLGPMLARFGRAHVSRPGGCAIGARPIDVHTAGMEKLGAKVKQEGGYVDASAKRLKGAHIVMPAPSVGATENLMMAAALARGTTRIENAAREPEIVDLADALTKMGARIKGAGTAFLEIEGVDRLDAYDHEVIPDRIEVGTFLIASMITHGDVTVRRGRAEDLSPLLDALEAAGADIEISESGIRVFGDARPRAVDISTAPHPGFPTDLQAQWMALMCVASGTAVIHESIFENRFMHVSELTRMGARIRLNGSNAVVEGHHSLSGAPVMATDLRASVCLVIAALAAEHETEILRVYHLDRGYERIEEKLGGLGAKIRRVPA